MQRPLRNMAIVALIFSIGVYLSGSSADIKPIAGEIDENGLFFASDHCFKAMDTYDQASIENFCKKINRIKDTYLIGQTNIFYSILPDKSYFTVNPAFSEDDYQNLISLIRESLFDMNYIAVLDKLQLSDYYKTDHHWRQECLFPVVDALGKVMDFDISKDGFTLNVLNNYQGVYSPYIKSHGSEESLIYLTGTYTLNASVELFEVDYDKVYNLDKWNSKVPYDIFLSGPNPLIQINNPLYEGTRELLIFGDSFSSSLAPLLIEAYSKITLIDLRFVTSTVLGDYISFDKQDVLFLYNTAVLNRSFMLK